MADLDLFRVDLDTEQPNGRRGEAPRSAFTKYNDLLTFLAEELDGLEAIGPDAPLDTRAYAVWIDTSTSPAMLKRRNAANDAWVTIGPALQVLGNIASQNFPEGVSKFGSSAWLDMAAGVTSFGTAAGANLDTLLTKAGNLAGLDDTAQSRLNLGVVQTLAGEVFNTDNCTTATNANGRLWRFHFGLQICITTGWAYVPGVQLRAPWPAKFSSSSMITLHSILPGTDYDEYCSTYGDINEAVFYSRHPRAGGVPDNRVYFLGVGGW